MQETSKKKLAEKYPEMKIVGNAKTFPMMKQFFTIDGLDDRSVVVKRGGHAFSWKPHTSVRNGAYGTLA